jgi:hypothetical protein
MVMLQKYKSNINFLSLFFSVVASLFVFQGVALAASPSSQIGQSQPFPTSFNASSCGDPNNFQYTLLAPTKITGSIYIKLPSKSAPKSIGLYSQQLTGSGCQLIGTATVNANTWTLIGNVNLEAQSGNIVISGKDIGAEPYAAVASAFVLPSSSVCSLATNCDTKYMGLSGYITPKLISGKTDQIALFTTSPVENLIISSVKYYSDSQFLYSRPTLKPFNTNYLNNGIHSTEIEVNFTNGQRFIVSKNFDNGQSWPGISYLRVLYYKSSNEIKIFMLIASFIVIGALLILIARLIHKKINYRHDHGLQHYHASHSPEVVEHGEIVVKNITD